MHKYTLPGLKKLVKRGSNAKILEWLTGYGQKFYQEGLAKGVRTGVMDVIKSLSEVPDEDLRKEINETLEELNAALNGSPDNGGVSVESEGSEPSRSSGSDTDDANSSGTSEAELSEEQKEQIRQDFVETIKRQDETTSRQIKAQMCQSDAEREAQEFLELNPGLDTALGID